MLQRMEGKYIDGLRMCSDGKQSSNASRTSMKPNNKNCKQNTKKNRGASRPNLKNSRGTAKNKTTYNKLETNRIDKVGSPAREVDTEMIWTSKTPGTMKERVSTPHASSPLPKQSHPITTFCVGLALFLACVIYIIKGLSLFYVNFAKVLAIMH